MGNGLVHQYVSAIADGGDATVVQPSNWNAELTGAYEMNDDPQLAQTITGGVHWLNAPFVIPSGVLVAISAGGLIWCDR